MFRPFHVFSPSRHLFLVELFLHVRHVRHFRIMIIVLIIIIIIRRRRRTKITIIIIIIIIIIINFYAPHNSIKQFHLLNSSKFSLSHRLFIKNIKFFLYYKQNLINIKVTIISIHASLKSNYKSILRKLYRKVFMKCL